MISDQLNFQTLRTSSIDHKIMKWKTILKLCYILEILLRWAICSKTLFTFLMCSCQNHLFVSLHFYTSSQRNPNEFRGTEKANARICRLELIIMSYMIFFQYTECTLDTFIQINFLPFHSQNIHRGLKRFLINMLHKDFRLFYKRMLFWFNV